VENLDPDLVVDVDFDLDHPAPGKQSQLLPFVIVLSARCSPSLRPGYPGTLLILSAFDTDPIDSYRTIRQGGTGKPGLQTPGSVYPLLRWSASAPPAGTMLASVCLSKMRTSSQHSRIVAGEDAGRRRGPAAASSTYRGEGLFRFVPARARIL